MDLSAIFILALVFAQARGKALSENGTNDDIFSEFDLTVVAIPSTDMVIPKEGIPIIESTELSFRQASNISNITVSAALFYIQSTGNPATIPLGSKYRWDIEKNSSAVCRLRIQFDSFDVPGGSMCPGDVLIIEGNGQAISQCGRKTGQILYVNFPPDQKLVTILFNEDGEGPNNPPLQLLIEQDTAGCAGSGSATNNKLFFLESKNFRTAQSYEPNLNQTYTIVRNSSDVCQLDLEFKTFALQAPTNRVCSSDYFEFSDHGVNIRQCGEISADTKRTVRWPKSQENYFFSFVSDATVSARGFSVLVTQVSGTC